MFILKVTVGLFLIATLGCHAKFTKRQEKIILTYFEACASDLGIKEYLKYKASGISGQQTVSDEDFLKLLNCVFHRVEFFDCDGKFSMDNFVEFITDGHNNLEQLPDVVKACVGALKGTPEEQSFQFYRCMFSQDQFKI
ncbi:hypothetical protein pipiens_003327 [Culex pipiens pipiens]|uniref:Uncharacterized protein n=1 Tax=Culex pipiens pipiens TaxID=38569 RepID=A0ABD1D0A1_CULPP